MWRVGIRSNQGKYKQLRANSAFLTDVFSVKGYFSLCFIAHWEVCLLIICPFIPYLVPSIPVHLFLNYNCHFQLLTQDRTLFIYVIIEQLELRLYLFCFLFLLINSLMHLLLNKYSLNSDHLQNFVRKFGKMGYLLSPSLKVLRLRRGEATQMGQHRAVCAMWMEYQEFPESGTPLA